MFNEIKKFIKEEHNILGTGKFILKWLHPFWIGIIIALAGGGRFLIFLILFIITMFLQITREIIVIEQTEKEIISKQKKKLKENSSG